ncbi:ATP-binding protein [Psychromarinibacter sp. C21-152]|uniref:histidine kinase n=1 Tax=Psychromarinibacter sediminicola TaxID=3033385 RepID=A0AAE3T6T0_9RHOB|nr:ATP-binding protein [Psychromarinibacter sediminicola]MDF0599587.1 ATP-binding protein [Psychromarinibacter sediminicola]
MIGFNMLVAVCLAYVALLFGVAFAAERRAERGDVGWLRSPLVYTLSLSIYCTAWTFYGAVGYAVNSGLEFVTIYLGPTLVMVGWWWLLRKLVRIGRSQRITSIADLISSRYGKSNLLGVFVTLLAVIGTTPYIALQLQSVTLSFAVFSADGGGVPEFEQLDTTAVVVAAGLTLFTILFGTRTLDANERHHGVVTAIALEAVVKLFALLAVGVFVVWGIAGGPADIAARIAQSDIARWEPAAGRWAGLIFLSGAAFLCLPRMFQVMVVENSDERHVAVASWAFPLYLFLMSLFVIPIAVVGLELLPQGNADLYVLTVPLAEDRDGLAMLSFLGGFSSATSMVIVAAIALSTMVSNHIVMPIWLSLRREAASMSGDVRDVVITARRISIAAVLLLGYLYFHFSGGSTALAAIGLISFAGVAQVLPALLGGLFWRGASRNGAAVGLAVGFVVWAYTLFLPSFGESFLMSGAAVAEGPFGIGWLRPRALFGMDGLDPVVHSVFWSMLLNTAAFVMVSLFSFPGPLERLQGAQFVNVFEHSSSARGWAQGGAEAEDLLIMSQRILGSDAAQALFQREAARQGGGGYLPDTTPDFIETLERELAGSVGAATAHAMVGQITGGASVSVEDLMAVADETAQIMEHTTQLEAQREELSRTARQLREANEKLTLLSIQKDAFLSQISHELRTPMTSIRAFSEIMMAEAPMAEADQQRFATIIHDEAIRLTRLLDDLLDLSVLENGQVSLNWQEADLHLVIERAVAAAGLQGSALTIRRDPALEKVRLLTDTDRLAQVFINLIANAEKYCDAARPELRIAVAQRGEGVRVDFVDNGSGIPKESQSMIFEKFSRLTDQSRAGGAGLGLAICREIVDRLGGSIAYLPGQGGAAFRVTLPLAQAKAAE